MKLAFIFDVKFTEHDGHFYSVNLTPELWNSRYLPVFDEIVVVGRSVRSEECPDGRLVRSDLPNVHFRCLNHIYPLKRVFRLKQESAFIKDAISDCDAVIVRGWWGVRECRQLNKNYMFEVVSCVWDAMWNHSFLGKIVALPYFVLQRSAVKNAPYVMYVTKKFLQNRYPSRGIQVGITDTVLPENADVNILQRRLERIRSNQKPIILGTCAAVDVAYKGQKYVIKALALLKKQGHTDIVFQMVGSGDQSKLHRYAEKYGVTDQIQFLGSLPHHEVFSWLDSIDLYIQPSFQEGLSRAVVEAMSRGLPCIVSDAGGNPELIEAGFVCNRRFAFAKKLAKAILSMSREKQRSCAERNYLFAQDFAIEKVNQTRICFNKAFAQKMVFQAETAELNRRC